MALLVSLLKEGQQLLGGSIKKETGLSDQDTQKAIQISGESVADGLKGELASGNISGITSLLKGNTAGNPIFNKIGTMVVGSLVSKMGLSKPIADKVSAIAVPFIVNKIAGQFGGGKEVNAQGLLGVLGGGNIGDAIKGGLGDKLGGLGKLF